MDYYTRLQSRLPSSSSSSSATFPPHRTQLHPRMHYSPTTAARPYPSRLDQRWRLAGAAALILPFLFYLFAAAFRTHLSPRFGAHSPKGFGVVIEAVRDGSRVRVFEYLSEGGIPFVAGSDGRGAASVKVRPGMRAFVDEPDGAGKSLLELLDFARRIVPRSEWGRTKVRLLETSGLDVSRPGVWQAVLESCRKVLRSSGFLFKDEWASHITGEERGVYTWVASNYALGTLGRDPELTTGIIELNEASTQIAFVPSKPASAEFSRVVNLPGITYNLYTSSVHHFNQERAWEFLNNVHNSKALASSTGLMEMSTMSPCIPRGYTLDNFSSASNNIFADSLGNYSECKAKALVLLKEERGTCSRPPCGMISMLKSRLQGRLIHSKNTIYLSELFGLVQKGSLTELESAGKRYCEDDWTNLREVHSGIDEADLLKYCFSSAYIIALLHDGLGVPMEEKRIGLLNQSENTPLDWTLGAFILQTVTVPLLEAEGIDHIVENDSATYIALFAFLLVGTLAIFIVLRWQRPQLKMIYDLEKGHYIVTRIPR